MTAGRGSAAPLACLALLVLAGCAGGEGAEVREHWLRTYDPRTQGAAAVDVERNFNLFRGQWWNHYARGCWLLELGHPADAERDFRAAIAQRDRDERDARSYGMHFWEYFPHRELGIALHALGRHEEAVRELEASLAAEESGRAKFYLNRARGEILRSTGRDAAPPSIAIREPGAQGLVNVPLWTLRGTVSDDSFVAGVRVAGRPLLVELAERRVEIAEAVHLRPGLNTVRIEADDLAGHSASLEVRVVLDRLSPVLAIDAPEGAGQVTVLAADDRGMAEVRIGDTVFPCGGAARCTARAGVVGATAGDVVIEARDLAGNVTHAAGPGKDARGKGARLGEGAGRSFAALAATATASDAAPWRLTAAADAAADRVAPRIDLGLPLKGAKLTTMDGELFLDGTIYDPGGVATLDVNGEPLPLPQVGSTMVAFSHLVPLAQGDNAIEVRAADRAGNRGAARVEVRRVEPEFAGEESRYRVGFLPPERLPETAEAGEMAYDALLWALLEEPVRFRLVERDKEALAQVLLEQKLSDLAARGTAVRLGKILAAEGVLFGRVHEGRSSVTLELRLVDTETTEILLAADVYGEEKDPRRLRWLAQGLVSKLKLGFPLLEGEVVGVDVGRVRIDIGKEQGLRRGMRLLFYREERRGGLREGTLLKQGGAPVLAAVTAVTAAGAEAEIVQGKGSGTVRAGDRVMTK